MRAHPGALIAAKRDGAAWTANEIQDLVHGVVDGSLGDAQLGALLVAVCCRGMDVAETSALTLAMRDSGQVLDFSGIDRPKVDKHSTGGVGDKVSLLLAPWAAAAGLAVPMISGRGLGHTGGTIDKLAAIPGYRTELEPDEVVEVVAECGFAMAGASAAIAPADRRMYAARDISGTVESVPLITSSILAKKLAEGIDGLVMDVKCGRAAFMKTREHARALMRSLVETGRAAGIRIAALMTAMDAPLGRAVGNALEVAEVVDCLRGRGPEDLLEVTRALTAEMVVLGGLAADRAEAERRLDELLRAGTVRECWHANVVRQGGDPAFLSEVGCLPRAPVCSAVRSPGAGYVVDIDALAIGRCAMQLGGGRRQPTDPIDLGVGVVMEKRVGDPVQRGEPLAVVHAAQRADADSVSASVAAAFALAPEPVPPLPLLLERA